MSDEMTEDNLSELDTTELQSGSNNDVVDHVVKRSRRCISKIRRQKHKWNDKETFHLIFLVKQHRAIWDTDFNYQKWSKKDNWSEVVNALNIDDVDVEEAKLKWSNLKLTFNCNMNKFRKSKRGKGEEDTSKVVWRFFEPMLFLDTGNEQRSNLSVSKSALRSVPKGDSVANSTLCSSSTKTIIVHNELSTSAADCQDENTDTFSTIQPTYHERAVRDAYSAFADMAVFKMRELPKEEADDLLWTLTECLMSFCRGKQRFQAASSTNFASSSDDIMKAEVMSDES